MFLNLGLMRPSGESTPLPEVLRKLLDSSGEVLTTESGEPLQHNLATENDMLFTDYIPNRSATGTATITTDTFVDVVLFDETLIAGTYEYIVSFVSRNPDTNDSLFWRVTGDLPSPDFAEESKDTSDVDDNTYVFQFDHAGGLFTSTLQMRKEDTDANDISVLVAGIYVKRVG